MNPHILIILDGWGIAPPGPGNAIAQANTPNMDKWLAIYPHATLTASGESVGLPRGEVGNTETGHLNIGAGQIVYQDLPRINMSIADGTFFQAPALMAAVEHVYNNQSQLHIMGLVGPGGVHSKIEHLIALIRFCKEQNISNVAVHAFTDGRDAPPTSALIYLNQIDKELHKNNIGYLASISGRYYAMDRDFRWDRTEKVYRTLTLGEGKTGPDHATIINQAYQNGQTDEFIEPTLITNQQNQPKALIKPNDAVIFFNFRIDRPRQLTKAFVLKDFNAQTVKGEFNPYDIKYFGKHEPEVDSGTPLFRRGPKIQNLLFTTMTEYEKNLPVDFVVMPPFRVTTPLGKVLADQNWKQLRAAESEKERFVTYYFNGQKEEPFTGEERLIISSPKVATYDLQPEMSAPQLTETLIHHLSAGTYQAAIINYANADMVGHTGNLTAAIKAVEALDQCLGKLVEFILSQGGCCLITADHGNAESMINLRSGQQETEHSDNPVPLIAITPKKYNKLDLGSGILADVAPTFLGMAGLPKPASMTGKNLLG